MTYKTSTPFNIWAVLPATCILFVMILQNATSASAMPLTLVFLLCRCTDLSGPVARYIGRNGPILHRFANEDVTLGAWLVGLEVTHVDERRFCCDSAERCMAQVRPLLGLRMA